jgi:UDP-glucuronate decarboxylase
MTATVLITGGSGFIGSHLCEFLLNKGLKVICVDNLISSSLDNIDSIKKSKNFEFIHHDIVEPLRISRSVDYILNFACPASPKQYQKNAINTTKTSVLGAINMLDLALAKNAMILQASTSEVYGDAIMHPQPETYFGNVNPIGLRSCYDEGKRCAESLFFDYRRAYNLNTKVIRIFNTFGPRMQLDDGRVVSNFIIQALNNENITIYGSGTQTRSFCYVDDLILGVFRMMQTSPREMGPINIGNPTEISITFLADEIIRMAHSKSKVEFKSLPSDDPKQRRPDITLAKERLQWVPNISLERGLLNTIEYFSNVIKANNLEGESHAKSVAV